MSIDITIVIPTFNGAERLPEVLELLRSQQQLQYLNWEIIIVDNNSTDSTAEVVKLYQEKLPNLRYEFEPQPGAGLARKKAILTAKSDLIAFLDDDNLPATDWIFQAYNFAQNHPQIGAIASKITPIYEVNPPDNFERIAPFFALTDLGDRPLIYAKNNNLLPPSAGLIIRKQVWLKTVPEKPILTGPTNHNILASEDLEMLAYMQQSSWEIWYNPAIKIQHKIPAHRFTKDYLILFLRGIGLTRYITRMIPLKSWQKPIFTFLYMINDLQKIINHLIKHKFNLKDDLIATCELTLYWSSFISFFYLYKHGYLK
jgi:glycosyltransferase involved in cell wall biosynthesis